jgi:hypothetical protein
MAMNCTDEMEEFDIFKRNDYNQSWEPSMLDSVEYGVEHGVNDKNDEDVFSWSDVLANRLEANQSVDESTSVTAQNNAGGKTIPSVVTKKTKGFKKKNPSEKRTISVARCVTRSSISRVSLKDTYACTPRRRHSNARRVARSFHNQTI